MHYPMPTDPAESFIAWIKHYLEEGKMKGGMRLAQVRAWQLDGWMGDQADLILKSMA